MGRYQQLDKGANDGRGLLLRIKEGLFIYSCGLESPETKLLPVEFYRLQSDYGDEKKNCGFNYLGIE